jgi:hypothetical protein
MHSSFGKASRERKDGEPKFGAQVKIIVYVTTFRPLLT